MSLFKSFFFVLAIAFSVNARAQSNAIPIYKEFPAIPPFEIMTLPDSTSVKKTGLKNKKATMFIVFSPDCDHCQHATKDLTANISLFKKVQIVMASAMPYQATKDFYKEYGIAKHPNIIMGVDTGHFLGTFFSVHSFPSIFLYDKKGQFVKEFEGSVPFAKIAASL
jgi:thioredoxin-related protein